ncbi:hypothetical protein GQ457_02G019310 [Hibiscus cannabinus]
MINQRKYVLDLLRETGFLYNKHVDIPMEANFHFSVDAVIPCVDKVSYQQLVSKLIYLSLTRPDIAFPTNVLSQHMVAPNAEHMVAAHRVLRYLKRTPGHGLFFTKNKDKHVQIFTYSSWASDLHDRRSTSGYCSFVWGNLVTWRSKKQSIIARSSVEAEFRALALCLYEGMWILKILQELFQLFCDNQSAIQIAKYPVQHDKTKHVEIDRHFIAEKIQKGVANLSYIPLTGQLADLFTKSLSKPLFDKFVSKLGLYTIYPPSCGGV